MPKRQPLNRLSRAEQQAAFTKNIEERQQRHQRNFAAQQQSPRENGGSDNGDSDDDGGDDDDRKHSPGVQLPPILSPGVGAVILLGALLANAGSIFSSSPVQASLEERVDAQVCGELAKLNNLLPSQQQQQQQQQHTSSYDLFDLLGNPSNLRARLTADMPNGSIVEDEGEDEDEDENKDGDGQGEEEARGGGTDGASYRGRDGCCRSKDCNRYHKPSRAKPSWPAMQRQK